MKAVLLSMFLFATMAVSAQNPITWTFTSKKLADNSYEIHMTATIEKGWHLYSQTQPDDAVAGPTVFTITSNPLIELVGKIKEDGKLEKFHDKELEISANQYSKAVNFVQTIKIKGKAKIPDYVQLRDDHFTLLAYFRVDRPEKALTKAGLANKAEKIIKAIQEIPYGKMLKLEL